LFDPVGVDPVEVVRAATVATLDQALGNN
jgi:hypothetical protein